jgi:hypothetical protein
MKDRFPEGGAALYRNTESGEYRMKLGFIASVLVAGALVCGPVQAQEAIETIRSDFIEVLSATNAALDEQSAFNRARAANDGEAVKDAAAVLLVATGEAAFWSKVLQRQVTAANTNEQMVADLAEVNELATRAFNRLTPVVLERDMAALDNLLDESADTLTGLRRALGSMTRWMAPA